MITQQYKVGGILGRASFAVLALLPLAYGLWRLAHHSLGANPIETVLHDSGQWALRFLLLTLALRPVAVITTAFWLLSLRRLCGLFAFFYALLHLGIYLVLEQELWWTEIIEDIVRRPYITLGMLSFILMLPLALTSTDAMVRRLGRHWRSLHRLVYMAALAAVLHYAWLVKADMRGVWIYAALLGLLFAWRLWRRV
jgi:methionine sulfoxide reductase heme-binding subunit